MSVRRIDPHTIAAWTEQLHNSVQPLAVREQREVARLLGITASMVHYHERSAMRKIAAFVAGISSGWRIADGAAAARAICRASSHATQTRREVCR